MIISNETKDGNRVIIYDAAGVPIPFVKSFDTITKEVSLFLSGVVYNEAEKRPEQRVLVAEDQEKEDDKGEKKMTYQPISVSFVLKGGYAKTRDTGALVVNEIPDDLEKKEEAVEETKKEAKSKKKAKSKKEAKKKAKASNKKNKKTKK